MGIDGCTDSDDWRIHATGVRSGSRWDSEPRSRRIDRGSDFHLDIANDCTCRLSVCLYVYL